VTLKTSADYVLPGEVVTVTWQIAGWEQWAASDDAQAAVLIFTAPQGFTLLNPADETVTTTLRLPVTAAEGQVVWQVAAAAHGPWRIMAALRQDEQPLAFASLFLQAEDVFIVPPEGGEAVAMDGRVRVTFSAEALEGVATEPLVARIRPAGFSGAAPYYLSNFAFEILVEGQNSKAAIDAFAQPIVVKVSYADDEISGDETTLKLKSFDREHGAWLPVRSWVDSKANVITAFLTEAGGPFDFNTENWGPRVCPT
jgi:hypothetical protein